MDITGFALVTGAASGIGKACAIRFAEEGAAGVAFADLDIKSAAEAAEESLKVAKNPSYRAIILKVDVSSQLAVEEMMENVVKEFGRLDYAVNSAGVGVTNPKEVAESDIAEFERFMKVNVTGTLLAIRSQTRVMMKQEPRASTILNSVGRHAERGSIINLGSACSYIPLPNIVQYTASKHAVLGMTRNAALDNVKHGIRVNCLCPSWVDTPMVRAAIEGDPSLGESMEKALPMKRLAQVDEIADVAMFLASPRSSYITGQGLIIDGGMTLQLKT